MRRCSGLPAGYIIVVDCMIGHENMAYPAPGGPIKDLTIYRGAICDSHLVFHTSLRWGLDFLFCSATVAEQGKPSAQQEYENLYQLAQDYQDLPEDTPNHAKMDANAVRLGGRKRATARRQRRRKTT